MQTSYITTMGCTVRRKNGKNPATRGSCAENEASKLVEVYDVKQSSAKIRAFYEQIKQRTLDNNNKLKLLGQCLDLMNGFLVPNTSVHCKEN